MKTIKAVYHRMLSMCPSAWRIFLSSLQLSCLLLLGSLLIHTGIVTPPDSSRLAAALFELPEAILLIGLLGSVCLEDFYSRSS